MLIFLYFLLYCVGAGLLTCWGTWYVSHKEENKDKVQGYVQELSEDLKIPEEDCIAVVYIVSLLFGFIILPILLCRKVVKFVKGIK